MKTEGCEIEAFRSEGAPGVRLAEIRRLLDLAFEGDLTNEDWEHALGGWHLVAIDGGRILAHGAVVERSLEVGERTLRAGYVEAVATHPERRGEGLGSAVMREVARIVRRDFELGALSTGRHRFYERLGWERWRGPSYVLVGGCRVRTEDEDDGILVLRFGPSSAIDTTSSITCRARVGDDW